jgi:hypothetical protein
MSPLFKGQDGSGSSKGRDRLAIAEFATMGLSSAAMVAAGVGVGYWLGSATGAGTVLVLVGLGCGVVAAVIAMYLKLRKYL